MSLRVYNTLTREKEDFQTVEPGKVGVYLCGPTVYKPAHIGHMVGPVIFDAIKKYLVYSGYDVTYVVNITDVDDKLINKAAEKGTTVEALAEEMTADYLENLAAMGVDSVDQFPKATDYIDRMLDVVGTLVDKGHAYPLDGDVYFAVETDDDYGKLSGRNLDETLAGTRVETKSGKRHPADFALWKGTKEGEIAWDSPWGPGRPGWHIECTAMSTAILGDTLDIHGGGLDLKFPHHENELAQSECCTGQPYVRYWMHNGLMQSGGAGKVGGAHSAAGDTPTEELSADEQVANKLAGSAGAESIKAAVFPHHPPETVRFFLLGTHYRSPIDFSMERIAEVGKGLDQFYRLFETYERITGKSFYDLEAPKTRETTTKIEGDGALLGQLAGFRDRFLAAMDDDFNTGGAIGVLFELRKAVGSFVAKSKLDSGEKDEAALAELETAMTLLKELAGVIGVFGKPVEKPGASNGDDAFTGELMDLILEVRQIARKAKNFDIADTIRDRLGALEVTLEDRAEGTEWRRG